jgi:hypothetical protein
MLRHVTHVEVADHKERKEDNLSDQRNIDVADIARDRRG